MARRQQHNLNFERSIEPMMCVKYQDVVDPRRTSTQSPEDLDGYFKMHVKVLHMTVCYHTDLTAQD
eukprot:1801-Heterococcus_DN1.PRE.3